MERHFLSDDFFDKNKHQSVVDQVLYNAITSSSNEIPAQYTTRTFRPILRYPPPPVNFLLEDELAWCDIDEISLGCHNFEYNYNVGDNWNDFLNDKNPAKQIPVNSK